jgi:hypothetical protein
MRVTAYAVIALFIGVAVGGVGVYWWLAGARAREVRVQAEQSTTFRTALPAVRAEATESSAVSNGLRRVIAYQTDRETAPHLLTREPVGDIPASSLKRGVAFLAYISKISTTAGEVTFDVIVDTGRRYPESDAPIYSNRHRHAQTLKLESAYIPMLMPSDEMPDNLDTVDTSTGSIADLDQYLAAIKRNAAEGPDEAGYLQDQIFVIHVDSRGVFELEQVFQV